MEQGRLFETAPAIEVGALYYDRDERRPRWVRVEAVEGEYAVCRCEESQRQSTIRVNRLAGGRFATLAPVREEPAAPPLNLALPVETRPVEAEPLQRGFFARLLARLRG